MAFALVTEMQADGLERGEGYRPLGRQALMAIIEDRMAEAVDRWLDDLGIDDEPDRRNGHYRRHLLSELGGIELSVPRTRRYCPTEVLRAHARRSAEIGRAILAGFVLGLGTRKVGEALLALLGRRPGGEPGRQDAGCGRCRLSCPPAQAYKALMLDGVVLSRKTGAGALKRPVLVALGIRACGKKEGSHRLPSWPRAKAPPNGSAFSPPSSAAGSMAKTSR